MSTKRHDRKEEESNEIHSNNNNNTTISMRTTASSNKALDETRYNIKKLDNLINSLKYI